MKILVPTDFSRTADKALQYAIDNFQEADTTFILYHSFMPFESGFYSYKQRETDNRETELELRKRLQRKSDSFSLKNNNAHVEIFLDRGAGERGILRYARKNNVNLIVMGTTGATGLKEKLIGSITASVISKSDIPVIGVPEKYKSGLQKNIAFCSNFQLSDIAALRFLKEMSKASKANIQIWHFHKKENVRIRASKLSEDYKTVVEKVFGKNKITFHFSPAYDIRNGIEKLSSSKDLHMIAMTTHRRNGFFKQLLDKSLTTGIAHHTKVPLLAIPSSLN